MILPTVLKSLDQRVPVLICSCILLLYTGHEYNKLAFLSSSHWSGRKEDCHQGGIAQLQSMKRHVRLPHMLSALRSASMRRRISSYLSTHTAPSTPLHAALRCIVDIQQEELCCVFHTFCQTRSGGATY